MIKITASILYFFILINSLIGQEKKETLFQNGRVTSGYGSIIIEGAKVNDINTLITGFDLGFAVNKTSMGLYYLSSSDKDDSDKSFSYRHTGIFFGFDIKKNKLLHPYTNIKIGIGKQSSYVDVNKVGETILVVKPSLGLELNVTRSMKIALVGSYNNLHRFENKELLETVDANGLSYGVHFIWGWWR